MSGADGTEAIQKMGGREEISAIEERWHTYRYLPFPKDYSWLNVLDGMDSHILPWSDSNAAACIGVFLSSPDPHHLDHARIYALEKCREYIGMALESGNLKGESLTYFVLLYDIIERVLALTGLRRQ
jgi:hypothetical protein